MSRKSDPDKVTHDSASFLGTGIGEAHSTTIHKGGKTYTGKGVSREQANREAGQALQRRQTRQEEKMNTAIENDDGLR